MSRPPARAVVALLLAVAALAAGCGGGDGESQDPITQVPREGGLQDKVRLARTPSADAFPSARGKTLQELADEIGGGPAMGLASSVFVAGRGTAWPSA